MHATSAAAADPRRRRQRLWLLGIAAAGLTLAWLALVAFELIQIRRDLRAGRDALDGLTLERVSDEGLAPLVETAAARLEDASDTARHSPWLRPFDVLPVADDQVDGMRRLADAAATLGRAAATEARQLDTALADAGSPAGRIALLDAALASLDDLETVLTRLDLGDRADLVGPVADAHRQLEDALERASARLADGRATVAPLRALLAGPSRYLLLVANNAEMTAGSGMPLSLGMLTFDGGDLDLGDVVPSGEHRLEEPVELPGDLARLYAPTGIGLDFRSLTRSPDFPTMGEVATRMAAAAGMGDVDGVLLVDPFALAAVLHATGPIEIDGRTISATNAVAEVLNRAYRRSGSADRSAQAARDALQARIATAAFEALTAREVEPTVLARGLRDAARGRHLIAWARDPALQSVWADLGADGALHPAGLLVALQNYDGDKLDWYIRPTATLDVGRSTTGDWRLRLAVSFTVPAADEIEGATPYILGEHPRSHYVLLSVHLPTAARDITTPDPPGFRTQGRDGPLHTRTFLFDVDGGQSATRTVDFTLPREHGAMLLLPSARAAPLQLTVDGALTMNDVRTRFVSWEAARPSVGRDAVHPAVRALVVAGSLGALAAALALGRAGLRQRHRRTATAGQIWVAQLGALGCLVALTAAAITAAAVTPG